MPEEEKSFWKTVPGIITGIAALITAITGLLIAAGQLGFFKEKTSEQQISIAKPAENASPAKENLSPVKNTKTENYEARFAMEKIKADDYDYTILGSTIEAIDPENRELKIKLRLMNNSNYSQANFWDNAFRLSVDGVPASPTSNLNELVEQHAAKENFVTFNVPNGAKDLIFIIMSQGKPINIPVDLVKK